MASLTHLRLLSAILGFILLSTLITVNAARPCKTLLISSYSITFHPNPNFLNRNLIPIQYLNHHPEPQLDDVVTIFTTTTSSSSRLFINRPKPFDYPEIQQNYRTEHHDHVNLPRDVVDDDSVLGLFDSLRDRTKDVLSVVVALLFGVGCGALTAGTMYFVFAIFRGSAWSRYGDYDSDEEDDGEEDIFSPKKGGYVMVPSKAEESTPIKQVDIVVEPLVSKD